MKWSDRKVLLLAAAVVIVLTAGMAFFAPPEQTARGGLPSVYATGPDGARAAYLLLRQLHYPVRIWTQPPADLPGGETRSLLILADPTSTPTPGDRDALLSFVSDGGRIVFTGRTIAQFFNGSSISPHFYNAETQIYSRNLPTDLTYHATRISLSSEALWTSLTNTQFALYGTVPDAAVVRWRQGNGEILWWAGPAPLTNNGISQDDNLNLFLNAVGTPNAGSNTVIYWDEYFHGEGDSLWAYFARTPLPWGLLQLGLIALAVLFAFSRRSGPMVSLAPITRRSPLEYVDTLGGLYERAHAEPAVVQIVYDRFRLALKRFLRLPSDTPDAELQTTASKRLGAKEQTFGEALKRAAEAAQSNKVTPARALSIIRELETYEQDFGIKKTTKT